MHSVLDPIARQAMLERDMLPDFSPQAQAEASAFKPPKIPFNNLTARDMRDCLWFSVDNDDSRDLDQITFAEKLPEGRCRIYVAIADVSYLVKPHTAIDMHALHNTTSVYTPSRVFAMLPESLSTDLTSLNPNEDRLAMVFEGTLSQEGAIEEHNIYFAYVHNWAKLAYDSVSEWLDGKAAPPAPIQNHPELAGQVQLQDLIAQLLAKYRHQQGTLSLETVEPRSVVRKGEVVDLEGTKITRGRKLIENFMIVANAISARFSSEHSLPIFRRVVVVPKRWDKIVSIAAEHGERLPDVPDAPALENFLIKQKEAAPLTYPDLSLTVIKLLGRGEYRVSMPGEQSPGHFGLALRDYTHSTAPNRRYPDLITQRLLAAEILGLPAPYKFDELPQLAAHCTEKENDADKVERRMQKSAAALVLSPMIGKEFDAIVTGASERGTWVRLLTLPVEGRLLRGDSGSDVGDRISVKLIRTDVSKGFIDFEKTT